ncbi:MAG: peroxide stress protein YaaA [Anaerovoracaceae bacterium]|nr:peroxide stress protein YaaA [Anaerovoracaceae bacterium]
MKIIISPAKNMKENEDVFDNVTVPVHMDRAKAVLENMRMKSPDELKRIWKCSDRIAQINYDRISEMNLYSHLTPAILCYDGIAFKYMGPAVFDTKQLQYVQNHLRILSAFYGSLAPLDGVRAYRLEMQAKMEISGFSNLYEFWGRDIYEDVKDDCIINLASKEYSMTVERYLEPKTRYITCVFAQEDDEGKPVTKATYAKMARGSMVRYMAEHSVDDPEQLKGFNIFGYRYREDLSNDSRFVYILDEMPDKI